MKMVRSTKNFFARLFHTRNIIIISPHRTNHLSISGSFQVIGLITAVACIGWASYSTGSYFAARDVLQAKDETIKSVASSRVETSFNYIPGAVPAPAVPPAAPASTLSYAMPLSDPADALSAVTHDKLYARIALLENKVKELRSANVGIIQAVREKTHNKIISMEEIIRQTGLNADVLKKDASRQHKDRPAEATQGANAAGSQGGPFIPAEASGTEDPLGADLKQKLDQMMLLNDILAVLPLGSPLRRGEEESAFGRRIDPINGRLAFHPGMDIAGPVGSPIYATAAGRVISAGWLGAYGNAVDIDHGLGIVTRYAHMSAVRVHSGEPVKRGQVLGLEGSTGRSTGPHVHYEVRYNDKPVNPITFLHAGLHVSQID
ncbi:MAG: M23 family metallopeptidase [Alphaproteobacteria bacterium]|nr:M23 family metallopeptidase [Alphaproteobacteria bacterium]